MFADWLADAVSDDWRSLNEDHEAWKAARPVVQQHIHSLLAEATTSQRTEVKESIRGRHNDRVRKMAPSSRERWNAFVDRVVDTCRSMPEHQIDQVAEILARLELSS